MYTHLSEFEQLVTVVGVLKLFRDIFHPEKCCPVLGSGLLQVLDGKAEVTNGSHTKHHEFALHSL